MLKVPFYLSALPALRLKNINISFVGLNLRDPYVSDSAKEKAVNDIGNLELSATLEDGRRVMSIVQNTKDPIHNSLDPYLTWDIPESWSLEDAATVPWAYSMKNCQSIRENVRDPESYRQGKRNETEEEREASLALPRENSQRSRDNHTEVQHENVRETDRIRQRMRKERETSAKADKRNRRNRERMSNLRLGEQ
ncbi:unnamed protein product, partial [Timema podura]|nr:unnamed protein product [Timema podura]